MKCEHGALKQFFSSSFFPSWNQLQPTGIVAADFIIQSMWHLVYPARQTYSVSVAPVGWRLWLASDVLNYWSGWLLLSLLSCYCLTAGVLVGLVVSRVVLGISSRCCSGDSKLPWAEQWKKQPFSLKCSIKRLHWEHKWSPCTPQNATLLAWFQPATFVSAIK